jgi:hypothetical protein
MHSSGSYYCKTLIGSCCGDDEQRIHHVVEGVPTPFLFSRGGVSLHDATLRQI